MLDAVQLEPHLRANVVPSQVVVRHLSRHDVSVVQDEGLPRRGDKDILNLHFPGREHDEWLLSQGLPGTRFMQGEGRMDHDGRI